MSKLSPQPCLPSTAVPQLRFRLRVAHTCMRTCPGNGLSHLSWEFWISGQWKVVSGLRPSKAALPRGPLLEKDQILLTPSRSSSDFSSLLINLLNLIASSFIPSFCCMARRISLKPKSLSHPCMEPFSASHFH